MQDHFWGRCFTAGFMPFAVLIVAGLLLSLGLWAAGRRAKRAFFPHSA